MSDSLRRVDYAIGQVNFAHNLHDGNSSIWRGGIAIQRNSKANHIFFGLVKMALGLVHASYSLPNGPAAKVTFFAPRCYQQFHML